MTYAYPMELPALAPAPVRRCQAMQRLSRRAATEAADACGYCDETIIGYEDRLNCGRCGAAIHTECYGVSSAVCYCGEDALC